LQRYVGMMVSREVFSELQSLRYEEWLAATKAWVFGTLDIAEEIGPYLILIHSSAEFPDRFLLPLLTDVAVYGDFPVQGGGCASGMYRGTRIWVLHQFMGAMATQLWMDCLRGTKVEYLIGLAEMTAYPTEVEIGDIVVPTGAIRGDLVTDFHVPAEIPAMANPPLHRRLVEKIEATGWKMHTGVVYSGHPGGVGVHNPILQEKIWHHMQSGVLGNAQECSVTLLESMRSEIAAAEAWTVSDDLNMGIMEYAPEIKDRWSDAAAITAKAALDTLADIDRERTS
jgi:uridine phosphorylase